MSNTSSGPHALPWAVRKIQQRAQTVVEFIRSKATQLTYSEAIVWAGLWRNTRPNGCVQISPVQLAKQISQTAAVVTRAIEGLRDKGLLARLRTGDLKRGASVYRLYPVPSYWLAGRPCCFDSDATEPYSLRRYVRQAARALGESG